MQLTLWNYRGLGNPKKSKDVKDFLRMEFTEILLLQETKIDKDALLFLSKTKWNLNNGIVVSARGTCGGLDTIWSVDKFTMLSSFASQHWIFLELQCSVSKISIALFDLYLPVNHVEKKECWLSLSNFLDTNSLRNIIVVGDLNIIFGPSEKKGGLLGKDPLLDFVESILHTWDLLDYKPKRRRFTWNNNRVGTDSILARLDCFLVQSTLLDKNFLISSKILPKISFDHHPISLILKEEEYYGPIPFRFSPLWIEHDGFMDIVNEVWSQYMDGYPSFVWEQKFKRTKYALKAWIKKPLTTPTSSRKESVKELAKNQFSLEKTDISHSLLSMEKLA